MLYTVSDNFGDLITMVRSEALTRHMNTITGFDASLTVEVPSSSTSVCMRISNMWWIPTRHIVTKQVIPSKCDIVPYVKLWSELGSVARNTLMKFWIIRGSVPCIQ